MNLDYTGKIFLNCAGAGEKSALAADSAFGAEVRANYGADVGQASGIFNSVNSALEGIVAASPNQTGESAQEVATQNAQVISNAAASNKNINASIREKGALTGAAPGVESGATEGAIANSEAKVENNLSNEEANITQHNYDVGRENFNAAVKGEEALPGATMAPTTAAANAVTGANETTDTAAKNEQESASSWMGLVGGLTGSASKVIQPIKI